MFIKYNDIDLLEFFENEPAVIGEYEGGEYLYSYGQDEFEIIMFISVYELYISLSITYRKNIVYSQKHREVLEIKKVDPYTLKVVKEKENIILKKKTQIGISVEDV